MGLLIKASEFIVKQIQKKSEVDQIIDSLLDTKKNLSFHVLGSHDGDILIEAISNISDVINRLEEFKEKI